MSLTLEYDRLLHGWQTTRDSELGGGDVPATPTAPAFTIDGFTDISFSQSDGWALRASAKDGLDPRDYHVDAIEALSRARPGPQSDADLDLLATDAVVRLAYHLRFGKVDLATIEPDWAFQPAARRRFCHHRSSTWAKWIASSAARR